MAVDLIPDVPVPTLGIVNNGGTPPQPDMPPTDATDAWKDGSRKSVVRNVLVMMPFRSEDHFARRAQVLEFMRLRHAVTQAKIMCRAASPMPGDGLHPDATYAVQYNVDVLHHRVGYFPEWALNEIAEADVLIGIVSHDSANVIFELAARHLLRDGLVLLTDGNPQSLPIYFEGMIRIDYSNFRSQVVDQEIRRLASTSDPLDFRDAAPQSLVAAIDEHERELVAEIANALKDIEKAESLRPAYIRNLARYMSPSSILDAWETYHPLYVIETWWDRMSGAGYYEPHDLAGGPWVTVGNPAFLAFYGLHTIPEPTNGLRALSANALIDRLTEMGVLDNREEFEADQARIGPAIFFRNHNVAAVKRMAINGTHDDPRFRGKQFLPAIVGRTTIGPLWRRHVSYHTVLYVPVAEGA